MKPRPGKSLSRRTTLTLPAESLARAERIARQKHLSLSAVVGEALERGLLQEDHSRRATEIIDSYRKAFGGFTDEELMLLDGVVVEPDSAPQ